MEIMALIESPGAGSAPAFACLRYVVSSASNLVMKVFVSCSRRLSRSTSSQKQNKRQAWHGSSLHILLLWIGLWNSIPGLIQ